MDRKSDIVIINEKFMAWSGDLVDDLQKFTSNISFNKYREKYRFEDFKEKLSSHKMEEFAEPLYYYMLVACQKHYHKMESWESDKKNTKENLIFQEDLVLSLKKFLLGGKLDCNIVNIPKENPIKIKNNKIISLLTESSIQSLIDTIRSLELNRFCLSKEEAIKEINNHVDIEWIKDWMLSNGYLDPGYHSFTLKGYDEYFKKLNFSDRFGAKDDILNNLIDEYAYDHSYEVPWDIQGLDRILKRISKEKSRRGPKEITADIKYLAFTLSTLKRLDTYLEDPKIKTMHEVDIKPEDLCFVHDVMAFFGLILDYTKDPRNEKNLEKTIRKKINDFKDTLIIDDTFLRLQILKFNNLNP